MKSYNRYELTAAITWIADVAFDRAGIITYAVLLSGIAFIFASLITFDTTKIKTDMKASY